MTRTIILVFVATLLIGSTSCSFTKGKGIAEAAAAKFHNEFNAGQFHEIYGQADEDFKKAANETEFVTLLEAVHRKLGTISQPNSAGWYVNATPMGTMVTLTYNIEFSEGKGIEQLIFRISDDKARLYNYNINSPLLITK